MRSAISASWDVLSCVELCEKTFCEVEFLAHGIFITGFVLSRIVGIETPEKLWMRKKATALTKYPNQIAEQKMYGCVGEGTWEPQS